MRRDDASRRPHAPARQRENVATVLPKRFATYLARRIRVRRGESLGHFDALHDALDWRSADAPSSERHAHGAFTFMSDVEHRDANAAIAGICRRIVEVSSEAIIFADREGLIRLWNRGAERIFGYTSAEVDGRSLDIIIPEHLRRAHWDAYRDSVATGHTKHADRVLTTRSMHKNGERRYVDLSFGLVKDANGSVLGAFAVGRDCTARYLAERQATVRIQALEAKVGAPPSPS
jgi:PAS domain S-box-containing protein